LLGGISDEILLARVDLLLHTLLLNLLIDIGIRCFKVFVKLIRADLGMQAEAPVDIDATLHIAALVDRQVLLFVLPALFLVHKWRDPLSTRFECFCPFITLIYQAATAALYRQIRVQNRVERLGQSSCSHFLDVSLHVSRTRLNVVFQRPHEKLDGELVDTSELR